MAVERVRLGRRAGPEDHARDERTLLARIRTALALVGAGVVIDAVDLEVSDNVQRVLGAILAS